MKKTIYLILFILILSFDFLAAQQLDIKGAILDINTHRPVPYVNIYIKGTQIGTISDFAGRYDIKIPKPNSTMILIYQHINYDVHEISINNIKQSEQIFLQPRVIPLPEVEIEVLGENLEIKKDLPQMVSVVKTREFELRGYVDAGDLLRSDHSVQVEEELSGKKIVSIRGGNADDVVVLYNGIKMNSQYSNIFDLSSIDLEDIERFEVIKGSNTVLYGSEAFSGVINIVPKIEQDYTVRFQQRIGTYDSGNWGLHFYKNLGKLHGSYRIRQGGAKRKFSDAIDDSEFLENKATHHTANLEYRFSEGPGGVAENVLGAMFLQSSMDYDNRRADEFVANDNRVLSLRYYGDLWKLRNLNLSVAQRRMNENQSLTSNYGWLDRELRDETINLNTEKTFKFDKLDFLVAYQYEHGRLNFYDLRSNFSYTDIFEESATLKRERHGFVSILKFHAPSGSNVLRTVDFDISYRHDQVQDRLDDSGGPSTISFDNGNKWNESMVKFASQFSGYYENFTFDAFMNIGTNFKFPSLSQLISSQLVLEEESIQTILEPEKNRSVELGLTLKRDLRSHPTIYGWQISGNYIKNNYDNKFRSLYIIGLPIAYFDNVTDARISGFEGKTSIFLYRKKVTVEFGLSNYNISEKAAFPFKYDTKKIANLMLDHAGYSFMLHWFHEGEQTGWIRELSGNFTEVVLPKYMNMDVHLSKTFQIGKLSLFGNFSVRNLLNDDTVLQGLALRDRRYYLTFGFQY